MIPEKVFGKWLKNTPTNAPFEEVKKVALHYLGSENCSPGRNGSHELIIKGPITQLATQFRDAEEFDVAWLQYGTLSISTVGGKNVKKIWIDKLIKLIKFKLDFDRLKRKRGDS